MNDKVLDLIGEVCPVPLLKTENIVENSNFGSEILIKVDHTQAVRNIMDWCEERGYEFEIDEVFPGIWEVEIIKSGKE
jgi:TusA-related sulfurtransferase